MSLGLMAAGGLLGTSLGTFAIKGVSYFLFKKKSIASKPQEEKEVSYSLQETISRHARNDFSDEMEESSTNGTQNKEENKSQSKSSYPWLAFVMLQTLLLSGSAGSYYTATNDSLPEAIKPYDLNQDGFVSTGEAVKMIGKLNGDKEDLTFETMAEVNKLKIELSRWGVVGYQSRENIDTALNVIKMLNGKIPK